MTKKIVSTLAGLILLFAVAAPLQASSSLNSEMTVVVPFNFAAGDKILPAGEYTVRVDQDRSCVVLRQGRHNLVMLLTVHNYSSVPPQRGKLVFKRYGASFFFSEVWNQYNPTGQELIPSAREKEMFSKTQPEQILLVQAR